ncbi:Cthe_2314 family HEPN domain-containing protein [Paenimyroides baculatum]|uniref:Uncharacterized protein n=1 Tax=Paenimyroides baculatum TaxID=2608000 RepID=A0A5M6C9Q4_9FLAO|nr:Cthe_2314 family HEPN domain-containing protein [Paenimyroides baculatum]KAA5531887.1 hypothetical protein F0460_14825 [Paenimyroides baculatum]
MSEEKQTVQDIFLEGIFFKVYFDKYVPIITASFSKSVKEKNYDNFLNDNEREVRVKKFYELFNQFTTILSDLEKTIIFLRIEDYQVVEKVYSSLENTQSYYTYFIENYIIRINSLSDVLGKILNLIYNTEIEKANLYLFRIKIQQSYPQLNELIIELLEKIKITKEKRHEKLHQGETEFEYLKNVVFWNELYRLLNEPIPESLKEQTKDNLIKMVDQIEQEIIEYVIMCRKILNISSEQLENYLDIP